MLQLKHSLRILFKYRLHTLITLVGLSVSISSLWFILDYTKKSYGYDRFHSDYQNIFRVSMEVTAGGNTDHFATTGKPLSHLLFEHFQGIEAYARMTPQAGVTKVKNEVFKESGVYEVNREALKVFSFDFLIGDKATCFSTANSMVLSRTLAVKYFNDIDIAGEQVSIDEEEYIVQGVFEDWPKNSHLDVQALIYLGNENATYEVQDWFNLDHYNYVLLDASIGQEELDGKLQQLENDYLSTALEGSGIQVQFRSQGLSDIYFTHGLTDDIPKGNIKYIQTLVFAGILLLLIAGFNYINLSLTQATQRFKEIAVKKFLGLTRKGLFIQSMMESVIITAPILLLSGVVILIFDQYYFSYTGFTTIDLSENGIFVIGLAFIVLVLGLLGNSYSSVYLSFAHAATKKDSRSVKILKTSLLSFQFAISLIILIITAGMRQQIHYVKNKDLGFTKEQVMIIGLSDDEQLKDRKIQFREHIKNLASVKSASLIGGGALPGQENGKEIFQVKVNGEWVEKIYNLYRIDDSYLELLDIELANGRNFDPDIISDRENAVIVNESLVKALNWSDPLSEQFGDGKKVIGVVKSFHNKSLHNVIEPVVFQYDENYASNLLVKTHLLNQNEVEGVWQDFFPDTPVSVTYFDRFINAMYAKEERLIRLLNFVSLISLVLSCMGLFATFSIYLLQKTKEISIRKVLGAGISNILRLLTKSYILMVVIAVVIAIPISWLYLNYWLTGFSYKVEINPMIIVGSSFLVLSIGLIAISHLIIKMLNINLTETLRYE